MAYTGPSSPIILSSQVASNSATITFSTQIISSISSYFLLLSNVVPITAGDVLQMQVNTGAGFINSGYQSGVNRNAYNSATITNTNSTTAFILSGPLSTSVNYYAKIRLLNATNGAPVCIVGLGTWQDNAGAIQAGGMISGLNTATNITQIQFAMSTGNISGGTFSLFGSWD